MKKFMFLPGLLVIAALVLGLSAFKKQKPTPIKAWFECIDPSHPADDVSYDYLSGQSPSCNGSDQVCSVYADVANPNDPTAMWLPVQNTTGTSENSLEQLGDASDDFTSQTADVKLEDN
ncbi:MAG TPA: hypothetical protein VHD35_02245 [Chitinophagaceae bacterium]|jgi:hypothetical protein|nr:hypothetical protein [Chitinophagaceae bacterium]